MEKQKNKKGEKVVKNHQVKIAFIGDSGVGKTCIIKRFIENVFTDRTQTNVGEYTEKIVNVKNNTIKLNIWDTAGQEKFRSCGKLFYKDAYIICLVYDITCKITFENLKNIWYEDLKQYGELYKILAIVGNKGDCYLEEQVDEKEAKDFAKNENALFAITSAKTGDGIEELFENLCNMYLDPDFLNKLANKSSFKINEEEKKNNEQHSCC